LFSQNASVLAQMLDEQQTQNETVQTEEPQEGTDDLDQGGNPPPAPEVTVPKSSPSAEEVPKEEKEKPLVQEEAATPIPTAPVEPVKTDVDVDPTVKVDNKFTITKSPEDVEGEKGSLVTLTAEVEAENPAALTYQWQKSTVSAETDSPQSSDEVVQGKQEYINKILNDEQIVKNEEEQEVNLKDETIKKYKEEGLTDEEAEARVKAEKKKSVEDTKNEAVVPDNKDWVDIPGAVGKSLDVMIDDEIATSAVSYRMVAKSGSIALASNAASPKATDRAGYFAGGSGSYYDPYLISTFDHFNNMRYFRSSYYRFLNDIDASYMPYRPIGDGQPGGAFSGKIDGNGYVVRNLHVGNTVVVRAYDSQYYYNVDGIGVFGTLRNAEIRNVGFENLSIVGKTERGRPWYREESVLLVGGIAPVATYSKIENCYVQADIAARASGERGADTLAVNVGGIVATALVGYYPTGSFKETAIYNPSEGVEINNCYAKINGSMAIDKKYWCGWCWWPCSVRHLSNGALFSGQGIKKEELPTVKNSYHQTNIGSGQGGQAANLQTSEIKNSLNNYAKGRYGYNAWKTDVSGYPVMRHIETINVNADNTRKVYDGKPLVPKITADRPEVTLGNHWNYTITKAYGDYGRVTEPTEIGQYNINYSVADDKAYRLNYNTSTLYIEPKKDITAPEIEVLKYEQVDQNNTVTGPYNPGDWSDKNLKVTFRFEDKGKGKSTNTNGYIYDENHEAVSGVNTNLEIYCNGTKYTATNVGGNNYAFRKRQSRK
ncbi:MAG: hypothetical protein RR614_00170, partial [Eubacterium sp.]